MALNITKTDTGRVKQSPASLASTCSSAHTNYIILCNRGTDERRARVEILENIAGKEQREPTSTPSNIGSRDLDSGTPCEFEQSQELYLHNLDERALRLRLSTELTVLKGHVRTIACIRPKQQLDSSTAPLFTRKLGGQVQGHDKT